MQYIILSLSIINFLLGAIILLHSKHEKDNVMFLFFAFCVSIWTFNNFYLRIYPDIEVLRVSYGLGIIVAIAYVIWLHYFLNKKFSLVVKLFLIPVSIAVFFITIFTDFMISSMTSVQRFGYEGELGILFSVYSLYFTVAIFLSFYYLIKEWRFTSDPLKKSQISNIFYGTLFFSVTSFIVSFYIPTVFNTLKYTIFDNFSFSVLLFFIVYAIVKNQLFIHRKVIMTEIFVFVLWIALFIRIIISVNLFDTIIGSGILSISVIIGIYLIKSVIKEVQLREEVEKLAGELKLANQGQVNLIHFMNHQIKGRLGNAKNIFAELLTDDYGIMPENTKPLLKKGLEEASLGVEYVQGVLNGQSAEKGTLPYDFKVIDFGEIVKKAFEKQKERGEEKGLKMTLEILDGNYKINADETQLGEAVRNLIDNSINYTPKGEIKVSVVEDTYSAKLIVQDTGIGLTEDDKGNLFKSGGRGSESLKINVNSTGYGLAFVKGVVDAHKGRVWAESHGRGNGSIFMMEIPKA